MTRTRCSILLPAFAAALLIASVSVAQPLAQGTVLKPADNAESLLGSLVGNLLNRGDASGTVARVTVVENAADHVTLAVSYTGFDKHRLSGDVRGSDGRVRSEVRAAAVVLGPGPGDATLRFDWRRAERAEPFETAYVRILVQAPNRAMPVLTRAFAMQKAWGGAAASTAKITPQPIGAAARLGDRPDYAAPPTLLVPIGALKPLKPTTPGVTPASGGPTVATKMSMAKINPAVTSQAVRQRQQDTADKTRPVLQQLPKSARVVNVSKFQFGLKPEDVQKGAQGPAAAPVELLEGLRAEDIGVDPAQLLTIATSIYPDKNPASGVFYYHPRAYHLAWDAGSGFGMRILYGAAGAEGAAGSVLMAARLNAGVDLAEVGLVNDLMTAYVRRHPQTVFSGTVRPLPIEKEGAQVSLAPVLGQYSIAAEKTAVTALSDVLGEIDVSWVTDAVTKENLQIALVEDVGLSGNVGFTATGGAIAPQVPIDIKLAHRDAFGRIRWNRSEGWQNVTPYPVKLRYLHALCINPRNNLPVLYSWSLGDVDVAPGARVDWDPRTVPAWMDAEAKRIWIDYAVAQDCDDCDRKVIETITGGVTSVAAQQIVFHTITPLADVGGYEIGAQVRSKYFDPKDRTEQQKSIVLKADNQDFTIGPIYPPAGESGQPIFEYLLQLTMPDGNSYKGTTWIPADGLRVLVGRAQLEKSIGSLPPKIGGEAR